MVVHSNGMRYATSGKHPWVTTTWERAEKKRQRAFDSDWKDFGGHGSEGPDTREEIFSKIADRVRKQHPELSKIKARRYARTKDPIGRKYQRLKDQGMSFNNIAQKIGYNAKTGKFKASSGRSGVAIAYGYR